MKNEKLDQEYSFDLRPASMEEAGLFYSNDEQDEALGTVGHLRLDFGHGFLELRSTGYPHNDEQFDTLEFKMLLREFLAAMQENGPLESLSSMEDYCQKHGGAITEDGQTYGYIWETERYPELKMLVDAVASSKVISAKKSQALIQKLGQLTSIQQAEQLQRLASLSSRVKPHNEKVYYIIDSIQTAILDQHQISFQYNEYTPEKKKILKHDGYRYILDPYALEWKNDHYYLIGYSHKHKGIAHFRVDRLTSVEPLDSKFQPMPDFDVAAYTNKMVDMFAAEHAEQVKLLCSNELMRVIIDHYGEDIEISPYDDTHFTVIIEVNPSGTFYGWVFKFMGKIRILSPQSCVDKMQDIARTFI